MANEIILILVLITAIFVVIETIVFLIIRYVNKKFQWLIIKNDENPVLSHDGLKKFIPLGYDPELGWVRKPNTQHDEKGKNNFVKWSINSIGARSNPGFDNKEALISCYGDSFTFSRQVHDNQTWIHYLSKIKETNVLNFGVGNYGIDQALLRLKREFPKNRTKTVILGVVPDTTSRIVSIWKHYCEYGNTFGFKPRFIIKNNKLSLIANPINDESKFHNYYDEISKIKKYDYFYKNKFKKELLFFPYSLTIFKNFTRNIRIIYWVIKIQMMKKQGKDTFHFDWNPMKIIMNLNLRWRIKLFKDNSTVYLLKKIIEEFVDYSKQENFVPIFIFLPQKDDLLFIRNNYHFYEEFLDKIKKISGLQVLDITKDLLQENNLDQFFSDSNDYGGHYSKEGNQKIASLINKNLK